MRFEIFRLLLLILIPGIISCGNARREETSKPIVGETDTSYLQEEITDDIGFDFPQFVKALAPEVEFKDGKAYRRFKGDTTQYRLMPDSLYHFEGGRNLLLFRCIPGDEPCSHADAAYFQLVVYENGSLEPKVKQESRLLPVYSPWCDKLEPRMLSIKGVPHLLFKMNDEHGDSWREQYWMISAGERNFGSLVWEEEIYTKGLKEGDMDTIGVFTVEEMEAEVEFDTTHCDEGVWVMNIAKTITKWLSNVTEGEPSPESQKKVDSFKPIIKKVRLHMIYRMNNNGKLVRQ